MGLSWFKKIDALSKCNLSNLETFGEFIYQLKFFQDTVPSGDRRFSNKFPGYKALICQLPLEAPIRLPSFNSPVLE